MFRRSFFSMIAIVLNPFVFRKDSVLQKYLADISDYIEYKSNDSHEKRMRLFEVERFGIPEQGADDWRRQVAAQAAIAANRKNIKISELTMADIPAFKSFAKK